MAGVDRLGLWRGRLVSATDDGVLFAHDLASESAHYRGECRRLTKQLAHFEETVLPMAIARGNRGWEQATNDQIERLWNRRADLCPEYGAERSFMRKAADQTRRFNKLMASAGRAALAFFTGGATGF